SEHVRDREYLRNTPQSGQVRLTRRPSPFPTHQPPSTRIQLPRVRPVGGRHRVRTTRSVVLSSRSISTQPKLIEQLIFVAPIFFDFHKQFEVTAMAQQVLDLAARTRADVFQTTGAFADDDLLLRSSFD